jgi:SAM-dependent methyltransferase
MKKFEKIEEKNKYSLNRSYFKNRLPNNPSTPLEVQQYYREHKELPYKNGEIKEDWLWECYAEYNKKKSIVHEQFFTPNNIAADMLEVFWTFKQANRNYYRNQRILEPCCGYGEITKEILLDFQDGEDIDLFLFDIDPIMIESNILYNDLENKEYVKYEKYDLTKEYKHIDQDCQGRDIICNPPYSKPLLAAFLEKCLEWMNVGNIAVLLVPYGFTQQRNKEIQKNLLEFSGIYHKNIYQGSEFGNTKIKTQIIVLEK